MTSLRNLFIIASACVLMSACGAGAAANDEKAVSSPGESASPAAASSPATQRMSEESAEFPASNLKPEDVSADKPVDATELRNAVAADPDAWKGKEVAVKGDYNGHSTSTLPDGKVVSANIRNKKYENVGKCRSAEEPPADVKERRADRVFIGKVARYTRAFKQFELEDCKITQ